MNLEINILDFLKALDKEMLGGDPNREYIRRALTSLGFPGILDINDEDKTDFSPHIIEGCKYRCIKEHPSAFKKNFTLGKVYDSPSDYILLDNENSKIFVSYFFGEFNIPEYFEEEIKPIFRVSDILEKDDVRVKIKGIEIISGVGLVYQVVNSENSETIIKVKDQDEWERINQILPLYKSGDILRNKQTGREYVIDGVYSDYYLSGPIPLFFNDQDDWELVRNPNSIISKEESESELDNYENKLYRIFSLFSKENNLDDVTIREFVKSHSKEIFQIASKFSE